MFQRLHCTRKSAIIQLSVGGLNCVLSHRGRTLEDTIGDKAVERLLVKTSTAEFKAKTDDSLLLGREVGNMYCASLYGGLASLFAT